MSNKKNNPADKFSELFENLPMGVIFFDENFKIVEVNQNVFSFGVLNSGDKESLLGQEFKSDIFAEELGDVELDEDSLPLEIVLKTLQTAQGSFNISLKAVPLYDEETFTGGLAVIVDHHFKSTELNKDEKDKFISVLQPFHDAILIASPEGKILISKIVDKKAVKWNKDSGSIKNYFKEEELNASVQNILKSLNRKNYESEIVYGDESIYKLSGLKKNGKQKFFIFTIDRLFDSEEKCSSEEIEELRKYQFVSETIVDSVFGFDAGGNINLWNEGAEKLFGYKRSEVFGKFIGKVLTSIDSEYFKGLLEILDKNNIWESELKYHAPNGEIKYLSIRLTKVNYENNFVLLGIAEDETIRKNLERELKNSEERYRNIVTSSNELIALIDLNKKFTYVNPAFINITGYDEEWFLSHKFEDIIETKYFDLTKKKPEDVFSSEPVSIELPIVCKNGKQLFVLANINPSLDLNGEIKYYTTILIDISEKKEAEKDILLIRSVFEASMDGIAVLQNRKVALANERFVEMFDYSSIQGTLDTDPLDLCVDEDLVKFADSIQNLEKGIEPAEQFSFVGKKRSGETFYVNASLSSYRVNGEHFIVAIFKDVTKSKEAERKLIESEERYRRITDAINDFLWIAERSGAKLKTVFYTSAVEKITGYRSEELIKSGFLWFRIIHPNDREKVIKQMRLIYKDPARENGELEYRIVNRAGNILWIKNKISITRDESEQIKTIAGLVSDITLSKRAEEELKRSAEELRNLNESKDKFISIISHDLRTPFSSILGYTDILLGDRNLPEEKQVEYISFIQDSAKNMLELVNALLDWTRLQTGRIKFEPKRVDAHLLANKCISMMGGTAMQKNINLVSHVDRQMFVHADESLILQVFNNLVSNAIKFTEPGGSIVISASPSPELHTVTFSVKDTGVGIKKEDMDKLFRVDSKFTLPGTSGEKGTGLGLSLVKEIVEKHGGTIRVISKYGKGTEFLFDVPVSSTTILLVDDLLTDRILYRKLIQSIYPEYIIKDSPNGKAAFEAIKSIAPLLVITEHKMPMMSGYDLIKQTQLSDEINFMPAFIVLARKLNKNIIESYAELGIEYVFLKPVELDKFRLALNNSLKKALVN